MTKVHKTKEGKVLKISEMTNSHLTNQIKSLMRVVINVIFGGDINKLVRASYEISIETVIKGHELTVSHMLNMLAPYYAEYVFRLVEDKIKGRDYYMKPFIVSYHYLLESIKFEILETYKSDKQKLIEALNISAPDDYLYEPDADEGDKFSIY